MTSRIQLGSAFTLGVVLCLTACDASDEGPHSEASGGSTLSGGASSTGGAVSGGAATGGNATGGVGSGPAQVPLCESIELTRPIEFRLEPPSDFAAPAEGVGPQVIDQSGTLSDVSISSEPCLGCDSDPKPALRLAITTTEGPIWTLVVLPGGLADQWHAAAEEIVGDMVTLRVRSDRLFQWPRSSGFVLSDGAGLVMAAEAGPRLETLKPSDLGPLEITLGADICRSLSTCGSGMHSELVFHGDSNVAVGRSRDGEFELDGRTYGARNSGGGYLLPSTCTDQEHVSTWAIWRRR